MAWNLRRLRFDSIRGWTNGKMICLLVFSSRFNFILTSGRKAVMIQYFVRVDSFGGAKLKSSVEQAFQNQLVSILQNWHRSWIDFYWGLRNGKSFASILRRSPLRFDSILRQSRGAYFASIPAGPRRSIILFASIPAGLTEIKYWASPSSAVDNKIIRDKDYESG
jgi:hypothetical protein